MEDNEIRSEQANNPTVDEPSIDPLPTIEIHPPSDSEYSTDESDVSEIKPKSTLQQITYEGRTITIGGLEEVDFDFSQRKKPVSRARKLVKSINRFSNRHKSSSMDSDTGKQDENTVLGPSNPDSTPAENLLTPEQAEGTDTPSTPSKRNPKPSDFIFYGTSMSIDEAAMLAVSPEPFALEPDRLPTDDKKALEIRLNYHLCELDHLKKYINFHNDNILQTAHRGQMVASRATPDEVKSLILMRELGNAQRVLRNVAKPFVEYHRHEIDRIAEIRVQMNVAAGLGRKVPQIFKNLPNDYEWAEMFMA